MTPKRIDVPQPDEWRTLYQVLPRDVYERLIEQIRRIGCANTIAPEIFDADEKDNPRIGPRVMAWECLVILLERTEQLETFRV